MALFNYSSLYTGDKGISGALAYTRAANLAEWLKIFVSPDVSGGGHLITHGIDLGRTYDGKRGLVPALPTGYTNTKSYLAGDGWRELDTTTTTIAALNSLTNSDNVILSASAIKNLINDSYAAQDALRFKGVITITSTGFTTNGDNGFPSSAQVGDVYKISGDSTATTKIAGQFANTGDMAICIKDTTSTANDAEHWQIVQSNIEHLTTQVINGSTYYVYSSAKDIIGGEKGIFAPNTEGSASGTDGKPQILVSTGTGTGKGVPTWANQASINAGSANKVNNILKVGTGLLFKDNKTSYDGSEERTINLLVATTSSLGGIKLAAQTQETLWGDSSVNKSTTQNTLSITNDGDLYITRQNVINALGYTPGNSTNDVYKVGGVVVTTTATGTANATTANTTTFVNITDSNTTKEVLGSFKITGGTGINITGASGIVTVSLKTAATDAIGGIKIHRDNSSYTVTPYLGAAPTANISGNSAESKYYGVQIDKNDAAFVHVPWISNIFNENNAVKGLVPNLIATGDDANVSATRAVNTTYFLGSDAKWYQLPAESFGGSWRAINVNGTTILDNTSTNATAGTTGLALNLSAPSTYTVGSGATAVTLSNKLSILPVKDGSNKATGEVQFVSTWRDVLVHKLTTSGSTQSVSANTESIGDDSLEFENVSDGAIMTVASSANNKTTLKSYLVWYNIEDQSTDLV